MKSGYKILWSEQALTDLQNILDYLTENWTQRELKNFSQRLDKRINLIRHYPNLFPSSSTKKSIRRSVLTKHTTIYYQVQTQTLKIVTLFDTRQNPKKLKFK
jgi:plasmid stabilization system protein ParE